jgi:RHS repeat-associated protein
MNSTQKGTTMTHSKLPRWVAPALLAFSMLLPGQALSQMMCERPPSDPSQTGSCDGADGGEAQECGACVGGNAQGGSGGMMRASIQTPLVSLALSDKPLNYRPAKGPAVPLSFYYSQREAYQPSTFHYANLGPKWTYSGLSYVIDDPARPGEEVQRYKSGGGTRKFRKEDFDPATGRFAPDGRDGSVLVRLADRYERHWSDGTVESYAHSDGKGEFPRRFFLTERKDPAGNRLLFHYDAQNRLTAVEDATGKRTVLEYKHSDPLKITAIRDPFGRRAEIAYDNMGRLISVTDAVGLVSKVSYSGRGTFIDTLTTPYGVSRFASSNGVENRWVEITDPLGHTERVEARNEAPGIPDAEAQAPRVAGIVNSGLSRHNTFYWDATVYAKHKGDYTKAKVLHWRTEDGMAIGVLSSTKAPLESRQWYVYDPKAATTGSCAQPMSVSRVLPDGETQVAEFAWNAQGNRVMARDPVGRETQYEHAPNGIDLTALRQKSATGYETLAQITWNGQRRPVAITDAAGQTSKYTWNAAGQITGMTNALGASTKYEYNEVGQLIKIINPVGRLNHAYTYDAQGNLASSTDSGGYTVKQEYDGLNRVTKTMYPDGTSTEYTWDKLDVTRVKDRSGKLTHYQYDAARNLVEIKDPLRAIQFGYDAANRLVTLTDGNGNTTRWQRDLLGRVIGKHTPDNVKTLYAYDSAGRQVKRTDALGQEQHLAYGKDNNIIRVHYQSPRTPTPEVRFTWDAHYPRVSSLRDGTGETRYRYGPIGQPGALQLAAVENPSVDALQLRYGRTGRVEGWRLGAAGEDYVFDALGRTMGSSSALGEFNYGYSGDTGLLVKTSLSGTPIQYAYGHDSNTGDRRLKAIRNPEAARSFSYSNAPDFIINAMTETHQGQSITWEFGYDGIDRLHSAKRNGENYQYRLDAADNLIRISTPEGTRDYGHGTGNRIQKDFYQYDPVGNRVGDERYRYTWDAENRLIKIAYKDAPNKSTEFKYDGQSRRVAIVETDGVRKTETRYTWCGNVICQARDAQDKPIAYYFREGAYRTQGKDKKEYYAKDHLGSIRDVLDEKGNLLARYDYDPYGNLINKPAQQPEFGYAGMHYHAPSGLYLTKYRAYDPQSGRWLSRDPIEEAGGINLYAYVEGNPVSFVDPLGLFVTGTYDVAAKILTLTDTTTGVIISGGFFSGGSSGSLPIPNGSYDILDHPKNGFFRLESVDASYGDDRHDATGRTLFRLHRPGASLGCITASDNDAWEKIENLILSTSETDNVTVKSKSMNPFAPSTESLKRYGTITVINSSN